MAGMPARVWIDKLECFCKSIEGYVVNSLEIIATIAVVGTLRNRKHHSR